MADRHSDHPSERTLSARMDRTFGRDHSGRSGLSIFFGETAANFLGHTGDALGVRGLAIAGATVAGGLLFAAATDLEIPLDPQLGGQFNLINGYAIVNIQNQQIALIRDKGDNGNSYGVYINVMASAEAPDEWRLVADPEQAAAYAKMAGDYLQGALESGSYVAKNDDGTDMPGVSIYYADKISVPYRNHGDDASVYVDMDARVPPFAAAQFKGQVEQTRDFWAKAAQEIASGASGYGVGNPLQLTDDYYFGNQFLKGAEGILGLGLAGLLGVSAIGGAAAARRRVIKPGR